MHVLAHAAFGLSAAVDDFCSRPPALVLLTGVGERCPDVCLFR